MQAVTGANPQGTVRTGKKAGNVLRTQAVFSIVGLDGREGASLLVIDAEAVGKTNPYIGRTVFRYGLGRYAGRAVWDTSGIMLPDIVFRSYEENAKIGGTQPDIAL